jgi:hypothetical protein
VLAPAQVEAILEACARFEPERGEWRGSLRDRLLFETLAETGVRLGEWERRGMAGVKLLSGAEGAREPPSAAHSLAALGHLAYRPQGCSRR